MSDETCPEYCGGCGMPEHECCGVAPQARMLELQAQLAETSLRLEQAELRIQEEDARAEGWKDTADERLRRLTQAERCIAAADRMRTYVIAGHLAHAYDAERAKFTSASGAPPAAVALTPCKACGWALHKPSDGNCQRCGACGVLTDIPEGDAPVRASELPHRSAWEKRREGAT